MSKREGIPIERDATLHQPKIPAWTNKRFDVASGEDLQAVVAEIKPFLQRAQSMKVKRCPSVTLLNGCINTDAQGIILEWSELDSFQLDDKSENRCSVHFAVPVTTRDTMPLFREMFQTARRISCLEIMNSKRPQEREVFPFPTLRQIAPHLSHMRLQHLALGHFSETQSPFEGIKTEHMKSLIIRCCCFDGTTIEHFLSMLSSLEIFEIHGIRTLPIFRIMENSIQNMANIKKLVLYGEADSRDTGAMERFLESIVGLKSLRSLAVHTSPRSSSAEDGEDNLHDILLKCIPRTTVSDFSLRAFDPRRAMGGYRRRPPTFSSKSTDQLLGYVRKRSLYKLTSISLSYSLFVPTEEQGHRPFLDRLLEPTNFEMRMLDAISVALSMSKFSLPVVDLTPPEADRRRRVHRFYNCKGDLLRAKMEYALNAFYFPIINALHIINTLADGESPLSLLPQVLAKVLEKSTPFERSHGWHRDYVKFEPDQNFHATALFIVLRGKPDIFGAGHRGGEINAGTKS